MEINTYSFSREPQEDLYKLLIRCGRLYCSRFILVNRPTMPMDQNAEYILDSLNPWLLCKKESNQWPGTELFFDYKAWVYNFTLNDYTEKVLIDASQSLYSWQQPFLPEDLCLLRNNGQPWLVTIAHEKEAYLFLKKEEKEDFNLKILAPILINEDNISFTKFLNKENV